MMYQRQIRVLTLALVIGMLAACGGGGSSSNGGDSGGDTGGGGSGNGASISSVGTITGFGSIYTNGIEFETDGATYRVDDEDRFNDSALTVGMKVRVRGLLNNNGTTGTATSIFYDDDVEGPIDAGSLMVVDASTRTFTIFGLKVSADASRTVFDGGASFDGLVEGQVLEVSGYFDGRQILASRLERQDDLDDTYELKGTVINYDGTSIALTLQNGINAGPFDVSPAAQLDIPTDADGRFVEVKLQRQGGTLFVIGIEAEDGEDVSEGEDVSIRGILATSSDGLLINGIVLVVDNNTDYEPASLEGQLVAGLEVMVKGRMQGGSLHAEELEIRDGETEIEARVIDVASSDIKNGTITLDLGDGQSLTVQADNRTLFVDESSSDFNHDRSFNLDELVVGSDFVEIMAYKNDAAQLVATIIKRKDAGPDPDPTPDPAPDPTPDPAPDPGPGTDSASIQLSFKLDPRLTGSVYLGERWVSPPVYTRVQEAGKPLVVDARALVLNADGSQAMIDPVWVPSDAGLVSVSPSQGDQVLITLLGAGESSLTVSAEEFSRELFIKTSVNTDTTLVVEIYQ